MSHPVVATSPIADVRALSAFGPDFAFGFDDWLAHPDGLGSIPEKRRGERVAVIGAGIAGVVIAHELMKLGLRPVVYEASRLGGRLRSEPFATADGVVAELGGMRFPVSGRALWHYIDLLGLGSAPFPNPLTAAAPTTAVDLSGVTYHAETLDDLPPIFHEVEQAWNAALEQEADLAALQRAICDRDADSVASLWNPLVERYDDRSFYDFLATSAAWRDLSFRHREIFGQVGFGTGGWDSDYPNSMLEILRVVVTGLENEQRLIVGGAEQIPRGLWGHAPDAIAHWPSGTSLDSLHDGAPRPGVVQIEPAGTWGFTVTDRWGRADTFSAVAITTQSWLLTTSLGVDERLLPDAVWMALDRTRYTRSSKTFVMVDRPFWHDLGPDGKPVMAMTLTDRNTRGTYLFDNGPDEPAVICLSYAWQADAMKVLPMSAAERAALAIDTLERIHPHANLRDHIVGEPITVSWESDPDFLGAFKGALPGHHRYNRRMYAHFMQRDLERHQRGLFLAGDDVSWTPGWAEGAVQTALNAVWGIMTHFGGGTPSTNPGPGDVWDARAPINLEG